MPATGPLTLIGTILNPDGTGANGELKLCINEFATVINSAGGPLGIMPNDPIYIPVKNGAIVGTWKVYGNDALVETDTFYIAEFITATGVFLFRLEWTITGAGPNFDIGSLFVSNASISPPYLTDSNIGTNFYELVIRAGALAISPTAVSTGPRQICLLDVSNGQNYIIHVDSGTLHVSGPATDPPVYNFINVLDAVTNIVNKVYLSDEVVVIEASSIKGLPASTAIALTGTLINPDGTGANGYLFLELSELGTVAASAGGPKVVLPGVSAVVKILNGVMQSSISVYGNDNLQTSSGSSFYIATFVDFKGRVIFRDEWDIGGPGPWDIGAESSISTIEGPGTTVANLIKDIGTGTVYKFTMTNGVLGVATSSGTAPTDFCLIDTVTGTSYILQINNGNWSISNGSFGIQYSFVGPIVDSVTSLSYKMYIAAGLIDITT